MTGARSLTTLLLASTLVSGCSRSSGNPDQPDAAVPDQPDAATPDTPDGGGQPSGVVVCDDPVTPPASGACEVTGGSGAATLLRGTVLGADTIYENGSV